MDRPAFVARASWRRIFASWLGLALAVAGMAIFAVGALIGPVGAALALLAIGVPAWQWQALRRRRIEVDLPGAGAMLRLGRDAAATTVPLDAIAGGIVHRTPGATSRGIRVGADVERWLVVGQDGRILARLDGRGFAEADLETARERIGGVWMSAARARQLGVLPADAPWHMRRPRLAVTLALAAVVGTALVLLVVFVVLAELGRAAFLWPWWA
ncbi:hypothetical protein [Agrococcus sp. SGAir0287]|uniref:hypothetical protein n=1 Tax=Agrococcus sp. SGAir0287 TaxID=2070347 RepID=UPI0010CD3C51|nr:hypothetical protein [Agrococcus sp. SGAir0287]QCR18688.1 hypothetical protein C1N71_03825 [Agrococcus sp. SGAir0287]